jgi:hypothetical protein
MCATKLQPTFFYYTAELSVAIISVHKLELRTEYSTSEVVILSTNGLIIGARGSLVVKALGYKPEGHGFETR